MVKTPAFGGCFFASLNFRVVARRASLLYHAIRPEGPAHSHYPKKSEGFLPDSLDPTGDHVIMYVSGEIGPQGQGVEK